MQLVPLQLLSKYLRGPHISHQVCHSHGCSRHRSPNAPKKPSGAYIWFCNDRRPAIKADHPEWGIGEIGKELGNIWKTLSDSDKKVRAIPCRCS